MPDPTAPDRKIVISTPMGLNVDSVVSAETLDYILERISSEDPYGTVTVRLPNNSDITLALRHIALVVDYGSVEDSDEDVIAEKEAAIASKDPKEAKDPIIVQP